MNTEAQRCTPPLTWGRFGVSGVKKILSDQGNGVDTTDIAEYREIKEIYH
jgi:hypothetical protein